MSKTILLFVMLMPIRFRAITLLFAALFFAACPAQRQPIPVGEIPAPKPVTVEDEQYGHDVLSQLTEQYSVDYDHPRYSEVEKVVDRIAKAVGAGNQPWHLYVLKDDSVKNAGATRGNHIFVWTGMINATQDESELATILSHEIGHVLAGHTAPDPSEETRRLLIQIGAMAAGIAASAATSDPNWAQSAGDLASSVTQSVGEGIFLNPYSQDLEYEADHIGLMLMGASGYNPEKAIAFWERAELDPDFSSSIQFLSSHPPAAERLARLRAVLPLAMEYYKKSLSGQRITVGVTSAPTKGAERESSVKNQTAQSQKPTTIQVQYDGSVDSFDLNKAPIAADASTSTVNPNPGIVTFLVLRDGTKLRVSPSTKSKAIGEFKNGAVLRGTLTANREWLEISVPEHGYIRLNNLKRQD